MSLRLRLQLGLALLVLVAVGSATWAVGQLGAKRVAIALSERSLELAQPILVTLEEAPKIEEAAARALLLQQRGVAQEIVVGDANGKPLGAARAIDDPRLVAALRGPPFVYQSGERAHVYAALRKGGVLVGVVRITAGSDDPQRLWAELQPIAWGVALIDVGLILAFGWLFLRRVIDPLVGLADAADRVAAGQLDVAPLPEHDSNDELGRLIRAFNRMTRSLREQRDQVVAQAKLATVGRLAAGVAHEVGNPLGAIVGYLAMLRSDLEKASVDAGSRELVDRAAKEADRMRALIADLVEYARPIAPQQEPIVLGEVVAATVALTRPQARLRAVTFDFDAATMPTVVGDAARLQQVLVNLFFNAADAMHSEGTITLRCEDRGERVALLVADDGPGVAQAIRATIFDPFFTTKEPGEGTGLGLAVSRSIVEAMGGQLTFVPTEKGATFAIELKRAVVT